MSERGRCTHLFTRRKGWWWHRISWMRWRCVRCGETTRTYDMVDGWMTRPIHPHMSVALPGYNTTHEKRSPSSEGLFRTQKHPRPKGTAMSITDQTRTSITEGVLSLIKISGENSRDHGFHEDWPLEGYPTVTATGEPSPWVPAEQVAEHKRQVGLSITQKLTLIMEEVIEAFGEVRDGRDPLEIYFLDKATGETFPDQRYDDDGVPQLKPEGFLVELADAKIRIADLVYLLEASPLFTTALALKHEYNATRPFKHGRKF